MYCTTLSRRKARDNFLRFSTVISSILPLSANDIYDGIQTWMSDNCNWRGNIPECDDDFDETTLGRKDLTYIEWFQAVMTDGTSKWMPDDFKPVKSEFWAGWPADAILSLLDERPSWCCLGLPCHQSILSMSDSLLSGVLGSLSVT